ncbi:hypothetical protein HKD37_19G054135 [Glycine soja]
MSSKFNYVFNKPCSLYMVIIMYQHNKQKRRIKGICLVRSQGSLNLEDNLQLLFTLSLRFFHMDEVVIAFAKSGMKTNRIKQIRDLATKQASSSIDNHQVTKPSLSSYNSNSTPSVKLKQSHVIHLMVGILLFMFTKS